MSRYDNEMKKMAYALCGIRPHEIDYIEQEDLTLMITVAIGERKRREYLDDARTARMTADIVNNLAQMILGIKNPVFSPDDLMPENRGKAVESPLKDPLPAQTPEEMLKMAGICHEVFSGKVGEGD